MKKNAFMIIEILFLLVIALILAFTFYQQEQISKLQNGDIMAQSQAIKLATHSSYF